MASKLDTQGIQRRFVDTSQEESDLKTYLNTTFNTHYYEAWKVNNGQVDLGPNKAAAAAAIQAAALPENANNEKAQNLGQAAKTPLSTYLNQILSYTTENAYRVVGSQTLRPSTLEKSAPNYSQAVAGPGWSDTYFNSRSFDSPDIVLNPDKSIQRIRSFGKSSGAISVYGNAYHVATNKDLPTAVGFALAEFPKRFFCSRRLLAKPTP